VWTFKLAKEFCNVARPAGTSRNQLPDLMRSWFGPAAGRPGTRFLVEFSRSPDGWWLEPLGETPALPARGRIRAYPTLRAAAGAAAGELVEAPEAELVSLPVDGTTDALFAVRASGDSMDGGKSPIRDGDWLVLRWARGSGVGAVEGRVGLLQTPDGHGTWAYQVKRIVQRDGRWWLQSDNGRYAPVEATTETTLIAQLVKVYTPEALAPAVGARIEPGEIAARFKLRRDEPIERTGRYEGHLFVVVAERGLFSEPDRLAVTVGDRRPGETAFVLARAEGDAALRYCGVGRWVEDEGAWSIPALDFAGWRAFSDRRDCSRRLPEEARARASAFADELLQRVGVSAWVTHDGKRCRIVERTREAIRIDGGEGGLLRDR
jgi:SOS-response transcriptional repressor LexA